jgi:hypothetical protein
MLSPVSQCGVSGTTQIGGPKSENPSRHCRRRLRGEIWGRCSHLMVLANGSLGGRVPKLEVEERAMFLHVRALVGVDIENVALDAPGNLLDEPSSVDRCGNSNTWLGKRIGSNTGCRSHHLRLGFLPHGGSVLGCATYAPTPHAESVAEADVI